MSNKSRGISKFLALSVIVHASALGIILLYSIPLRTNLKQDQQISLNTVSVETNNQPTDVSLTNSGDAESSFKSDKSDAKTPSEVDSLFLKKANSPSEVTTPVPTVSKNSAPQMNSVKTKNNSPAAKVKSAEASGAIDQPVIDQQKPQVASPAVPVPEVTVPETDEKESDSPKVEPTVTAVASAEETPPSKPDADVDSKTGSPRVNVASNPVNNPAPQAEKIKNTVTEKTKLRPVESEIKQTREDFFKHADKEKARAEKEFEVAQNRISNNSDPKISASESNVDSQTQASDAIDTDGAVPSNDANSDTTWTDVRDGSGNGYSGGSSGLRTLGDLKALPNNPRPHYDKAERLNGDQGVVIFHSFITEEGTTSKFILIQSSGVRSLDSKSLKALKQYKFEPGQKGWAELSFKWTLEGDAQPMTRPLRSKIN